MACIDIVIVLLLAIVHYFDHPSTSRVAIEMSTTFGYSSRFTLVASGIIFIVYIAVALIAIARNRIW